LWARSNATPRFYAIVIGIFAAFAVLLCAIGLYGVVAFAAGQRKAEIGLRMALGATQAQIGTLMAYGAIRSVVFGVVLGGVGSLALFQGIDRFLYGMDPVDPVVFAMVAVSVALLAISASYLPARRASQLDPVEALRAE
jgi:putative ABC transport system permease protein